MCTDRPNRSDFNNQSKSINLSFVMHRPGELKWATEEGDKSCLRMLFTIYSGPAPSFAASSRNSSSIKSHLGLDSDVHTSISLRSRSHLLPVDASGCSRFLWQLLECWVGGCMHAWLVCMLSINKQNAFWCSLVCKH